MKKALIALVLMLLTSSVNALEVNNLDITLNIDSDGYAGVTEAYSLQFISPFEKTEFNEKSIENSSSITSWQADYEFFFPHFGGTIDKLSSSTITYDNTAQKLTFEYSLKEKLATLIAEEQRADFFELDDRQLFAFNDSGTIVIPENTSIQIILPPNSEIGTETLPGKAVINGNTILLRGIQSNSLTISYKILKPIAPTSNQLIEGISNFYVVVGPILIVLLVIILVKRESLEKKVENYLVDHSEIKSREPKEDIDLEFD